MSKYSKKKSIPVASCDTHLFVTCTYISKKKWIKWKFVLWISNFCLKCFSTEQVFNELRETLGEIAPPYSIMARLCTEFKRGRTTLKDNPRSGRSSRHSLK